jgi:hypothetical protein
MVVAICHPDTARGHGNHTIWLVELPECRAPSAPGSRIPQPTGNTLLRLDITKTLEDAKKKYLQH